MLKAIAANIARIAAKATLCAAACQLAAVILIAPVALMPGQAAAQAQPVDCAAQNKMQTSPTACGACLPTHLELNNDDICLARNPDCFGDNPPNPQGRNTLDEETNMCVCPDDTELREDVAGVKAGDSGAMLCQTLEAFCNSTEEIPDMENNTCVGCPLGQRFFRDEQRICQQPATCFVRGQSVAEHVNECECPSGHTPTDNRVIQLDDSYVPELLRTCAPRTVPNYALHTAADCTSAGWEVNTYAVAVTVNSGGFRLVESCAIPIRFIETSVAASAGPFQAEDQVNSCILWKHADVDATDLPRAVGPRNAQNCEIPELFGTDGLPQKPDGFFNTRLVVKLGVATGAPDRIYFGGKPVPLAGAAPPPVVDPTIPPVTDPDPDPDPDPVATPTPSGGGSGGPGAFMGGGILLVGVAAYFISSDPQAAALSFDPLASYAFEDGVGRYRYGSRLEFRRDDWTLWWTADESRHGDSSAVRRYGYGGEWSRDAWRAAVSAYSDADAADMEMRAALETEWTLHDWRLRPAWRLSASGGGESEWRVENALNLAAELARAGWTVRPSVDANLWPDDAAAARLRLRVGREF